MNFSEIWSRARIAKFLLDQQHSDSRGLLRVALALLPDVVGLEVVLPCFWTEIASGQVLAID